MSSARSLQFLLSDLLDQHPEATDEQLLELYCAKVKEVPALLALVLGCSFDETLADIREPALDAMGLKQKHSGPQTAAWLL